MSVFLLLCLMTSEDRAKRLFNLFDLCDGVKETDVSFNYISRGQPTPTAFYASTINEILSTDFNPSRRTMFVIHGLKNSKDSPVSYEISSALLNAEDDWNVFVVDWSKADKLFVLHATSIVPKLGDLVAHFVHKLIKTTGLSLDKVQLSGHSLGAHVCGRVGNIFQGQIETILGLDPAKLAFIDLSDIDKRLDPTDAKYVQVIHTSLLGIQDPIGHADFYPNGGQKQKGCTFEIEETLFICSHGKSFSYFAESIVNKRFKAIYCESKADWEAGRCDNNRIAYMGGNNLERVYGTFYLSTEEEKPFRSLWNILLSTNGKKPFARDL